MILLEDEIPAQMKEQLITKNQTVKDIAGQLLRAELVSQKDWPVLRKKFKRKSEYDTCCDIYDWMQEHIEYYKEPKTRQNAKTVGRIIADGFGDCKAFGTFAVSATRACGIPAIFRLASYDWTNRDPTHIYCLAFPNDKKLTIDGVLEGKPIGTEARARYAYNLNPVTP